MTSCELPKGQVNQKVARANAFFTLILSLLFIFTNAKWIIYIMVIDFLIKGFIGPKFSPISRINIIILRILKIKPKPIFAPPKIFASKIGFIFSLAIMILFLLGLPIYSIIIISILAFFAFLESTFEICIGCWAHSYWLKLFKNKR